MTERQQCRHLGSEMLHELSTRDGACVLHSKHCHCSVYQHSPRSVQANEVSNRRIQFNCGKTVEHVMRMVTCVLTVHVVTGLHLHQQQEHNQQRSGFSPYVRSTGDNKTGLDSSMYLARFGYLPQSDMETGALRSKEEFEAAVRRFQRFASLPQTGQLDKATLAYMRKPRCGLPDVMPQPRLVAWRRRRYVIGPNKWHKKDLTFRILNYSPDLQSREIRTAIYRAFQVWADVSQLTYREVFHQPADIEIVFASGYHSDGYPFDGPGSVLAHAFPPGDERGGDVHFDEDEKWSFNSYEGIDLFTSATHEIGHALGLYHSSEPGSVMAPWFQGYNPHFKLSDDDIAAISYLYGAKQSARRPAPSSTPSPTTRLTTPTTSVTVMTSTTSLSPASSDTPLPHHCHTTVDALAIIRGELFAFKGKWFWRLSKHGQVNEVPAETHQFWYGLPDDVSTIDAVFERPDDGRICFFSGSRYWLFQGNQLSGNFPTSGRPLTHLGLPADVEKVDAAFVWGHNKLPYIIAGSMYWRLSYHGDSVMPGYPRDMNMWAGVPLPVDDAFLHWNGRTYFVRGLYTYEFNDMKMRIREEGGVRLLANHIFHCLSQPISSEPIGSQASGSSSSSGSSSLSQHVVSVLIIIAYMCFQLIKHSRSF